MDACSSEQRRDYSSHAMSSVFDMVNERLEIMTWPGESEDHMHRGFFSNRGARRTRNTETPRSGLIAHREM